MQFKLKGKIIHIADERVISEKFKVREFVLEVEDGKYPQEIVFQLINDNTAAINGYGIGDLVTSHFDIRGRSHGDRWFNNLNAWKIERVEAGYVVPDVLEQPGETLPF